MKIRRKTAARDEGYLFEAVNGNSDRKTFKQLPWISGFPVAILQGAFWKLLSPVNFVPAR